jgi:hypothetical protein
VISLLIALALPPMPPSLPLEPWQRINPQYVTLQQAMREPVKAFTTVPSGKPLLIAWDYPFTNEVVFRVYHKQEFPAIWQVLGVTGATNFAITADKVQDFFTVRAIDAMGIESE